MKKNIIKLILLGILSVFLLYGTIHSYSNSDPWGLAFMTITIPFAILSVITVYNVIKILKLILKNDNSIVKGKRFKPIYFLSVIVVLVLFVGMAMFRIQSPKSDKIPKDYIAVFNGGSGEVTYSTYIYKINNKQANYGFKYINTTNTTLSWGNPNWNIEITSKGTVNWTDDVFTVAEKNNAYSYVKLPNDNKKYSIDEFMSMFLMN